MSLKAAIFRVLMPALVALAGYTPWISATPPAPPIVGRVIDSSGAPLSNALVVVGGTRRSAMTDEDGRFVIRALPAGSYHVEATLIGYAPGHAEVDLPASGVEVQVEIVLEPSPLSLEGVIVTGTTGTTDPLTITQSTTQLSGKAFDRRVGATVAATLANEPGISMRYAGPAAATPVIRGLSGDRVLMLENGQRTGDLSGASADHALSIDPLSASRIEVVRGPASLLYGSSALGGVVNVIGKDVPTSVPTQVEGYIAAQGESVSSGGGITAEATVPLGETLALTARGGLRDASDVRVGGGDVLGNSFSRSLQGNLGLGYITERFSGGLALSAHGFDYGLPFGHGHGHEEEAEHADEGPAHAEYGAEPGHAAHEEEEHEAEVAGINIRGHRAQLSGNSQWVLDDGYFKDLSLNATAQWYVHDEIEPSGEIGTTFRLNTQTADLKVNTEFGMLRGTIGAAGLLKQYAPTGEEALTPSANSSNAGIFVYQEMPLLHGTHDSEYVPHLQLGGRFDLYRIASEESGEQFGQAHARDFRALTGSVGVNVPLGRTLSLGASVARAFRAPTVEELFSHGFHAAAGSFDIGRPDLEAETNLGAESVLRVQTRRVNLSASVYRNRINDFIAPHATGRDTILTEGEEAVVVPINTFTQADAVLRGIEGKIEAVVVPDLVLSVQGDLVRGTLAEGGPLPFMPAAHVGGGARWDNGKLGLGTSVRHAFAQAEVPEHEFATEAYTLVGLDLNYTLRTRKRIHTLTLRADNLLDAVYRDATSRIKEFAPNPGRNVTLVYRLLF